MTDQELAALKEFFELKFKDSEALNDERAKAIKEALSIRNTAEDKYQEEFAKRYEEKHEKVCGEINELKLWRSNMEGKASQNSVNIVLGIAVLSIIVSIVLHFV